MACLEIVIVHLIIVVIVQLTVVFCEHVTVFIIVLLASLIVFYCSSLLVILGYFALRNCLTIEMTNLLLIHPSHPYSFQTRLFEALFNTAGKVSMVTSI